MKNHFFNRTSNPQPGSRSGQGSKRNKSERKRTVMPDCLLIDSEVPATHQRFFSQSAEEPPSTIFFAFVVLFHCLILCFTIHSFRDDFLLMIFPAPDYFPWVRRFDRRDVLLHTPLIRPPLHFQHSSHSKPHRPLNYAGRFAKGEKRFPPGKRCHTMDFPYAMPCNALDTIKQL